jgi:hypothetical protein
MSPVARLEPSARARGVATTRPGPVRAAGACVLLAALALAGAAAAQDFSSPAGGGPSPSALVALETGLPHARSRLGVEVATTRWFDLPDFSTRAIGIGAGWRSLRAALGLSATGDRALGWTSAAASFGAAGSRAGAGLRAVARRERAPDSTAVVLGPGVGAEAGGAAWVAAANGLVVWASAPQLWTRGTAPPLARALEIGAVYSVAGVELWLAREAPRRTAESAGMRRAGLLLRGGAWRAWLEARDRPLRAGAGLAASARGATLAVEVESHPVLGETTRLAIGLGANESAR